MREKEEQVKECGLEIERMYVYYSILLSLPLSLSLSLLNR